MKLDLGAFEHNVRILRGHLGPDIHIIAVLKSDAYGHGIGPVAKRLAACDIHSFAAGSLRDARALRRAGVDTPVLMFAVPMPVGMPVLLASGLTPTVHDWNTAEAVSYAASEYGADGGPYEPRQRRVPGCPALRHLADRRRH